MQSDTVGVVVIGTGGIGRYHLELWRETPGVEVVGVYDQDREVATRAAKKTGVKHVYDSLDQALNEPRVDAIDICTPNRSHLKLVIAALEGGKHCLCEKPLAVTSAEIEQMIAARDSSGKLLMTAQHMRFEQRSAALKRIIDQGELGLIYHARAWWLRRRRAPTSPGLLTRAQAAYGPGLDLGVHMLDLAMHFMDFPQPVSVSGVALRELALQPDVANEWGLYQPEDFEVEDFAAAMIRFATGGGIVTRSQLAAEHA